MDVTSLLQALTIGEDGDWEFKSARGGVPGSMWETYSAMANTDGGAIALGAENDGTVSGLNDSAKMQKQVWDCLNNRQHVSINLLRDEQVKVLRVEGKLVLVMEVPRADRRQRPVFVGPNPLTGTYRRNYEGDYRCSQEEVRRMFADQSEDAFDGRVLEHFGLDDLDEASIQQYRNIWSARDSAHPWHAMELKAMLEKIGAWRRDRNSGKEGPTVAGLLMFGRDEAIRDPEAVPQFNLDYRERLSDDPNVRWTDRLTADGKWVCNLFQFYQKVALRLMADLKVPFALNAQMVRQEDTVVHQAVREALVNSLIHADFRGQGGVIVEKYRDRFTFSNPGTLLLELEQILRGGRSECRNKLLQGQFLFLGIGERAGSGIDKIRQGWASQHWRLPSIRETLRPDRVDVTLSMVSLLPAESVKRLQRALGNQWASLRPIEVQALVTADVEGRVTNARLREMSEEHPSDLTRALQGLAGRGFLEQVGQKRGTFYRLSGIAQGAAAQDSMRNGVGSMRNGADSMRNGGGSMRNGVGSMRNGGGAPVEEAELIRIAQPAREKRRLSPERMRAIILELCDGRYLSLGQLAQLLQRDPVGIRNRLLSSLLQAGRLTMRYPDEPNRPDQAYTTKKPPGAP